MTVYTMTFEDSREPLMSAENRSLEKEEWVNFTRPRSVQDKNKRIKGALLYAVIIFPWILLAVLGICTWNLSLRYKSRWYVRPDLVYSKCHSSEMHVRYSVI